VEGEIDRGGARTSILLEKADVTNQSCVSFHLSVAILLDVHQVFTNNINLFSYIINVEYLANNINIINNDNVEISINTLLHIFCNLILYVTFIDREKI
jgi:hypothetical protein